MDNGAVTLMPRLSPTNRRLVMELVLALAAQEGIELEDRTQAPGPSPAEYIPAWVNALQGKGWSPRTIAGYRNDVARYLNRDPQPTAGSIERYMAERLDAGLSTSRVGNEQKALKSFFSHLAARGLITDNPTAHIKLIRERKAVVRCPSDEDVAALLRIKLYRHEDTRKFRVMTALLANTGLRVTEACSAELSNLDLEHGSLKVLGKGNKERIVLLPDGMIALLREYLGKRTDSPYLFPGEGATGYWNTGSYERTMQRACKRLGIEPVTPHKLRHYFATRALRRGMKLEVVSRLLGHSSVAITIDIYRHIMDTEIRDEYRKFAHVLPDTGDEATGAEAGVPPGSGGAQEGEGARPPTVAPTPTLDNGTE